MISYANNQRIVSLIVTQHNHVLISPLHVQKTKKCIVSCNIEQEESCNYMMIDGTKSSELTIENCEMDKHNSCNNITAYCPTTTIHPITCTITEPCYDMCNNYPSESSQSSLLEIITTLGVLYYIAGIFALAIFCGCCIILFYIYMSLSYNKTLLKHQMNVQMSRIKSLSQSSIPAKFDNEK
eukprot:287600_1